MTAATEPGHVLGHVPEHVYVDIGVVRVQSYLSRTSSLRGHRAASHTLAAATAREAVERAVDGLAEVNAEAGEVDGVVSLRFDVAPDEDPAPRVRLVQDAVLARLRQALPGAEFTSVWGRGTSYVEVYQRQMKPRVGRGEVRYDLPPPAEFPLAAPCRTCHVGPAAGEAAVTGSRRQMCPDCLHRNIPRDTMLDDGGTPEGRLVRDLGLDRPPEMFPALAALGGGEGNHLATVAADGNAFGEFFGELARQGSLDPGLRQAKEELSAKLSQATRDALQETVYDLHIEYDYAQLCVIPHVVGGDDVLLSMPADWAWKFTITFLQRFHASVREATADLVDRLNGNRTRTGRPGLVPPTASAGVVFSHHKEPLNLLRESAYDRMAEAKREAKGRQSSIQWLDLTADGPDAPRHRPVLLAQLRTPAGEPADADRALSRLAGVPPAHRARLAGVLRDRGPLTAAAVESRRVGHWEAVRPFLPPLDGPPDGDPPCGIGLGAALGMARWWPCA
ncbi:hypothetical protein OG946_05010 [Streptomyces sp. NBC_01808]|uniref:Cas10/Cmr2 second palm domain-containing protein n=1 Tax=Streptomyces sp. NBC_01808 TaxID=2975947 RepID=UPI002DD7D644|nr:hypothetical protein [Streptomyces sp. NBC_01808]WSA36798.1 hypothetical protein OG946_05010 [Streptomyces sp. NBC_01808]